jgi:hypothetical protein
MSQRTRLAAFLGLLMAAAGASAQEPANPPEAKKPPIPLKLQVVFARHVGDKKVSNAPYTVSLNADLRPSKLRMILQVPIRTENKEGKNEVVYKDVGNSLDCWAEALPGGRFRLNCSFDLSSFYSAEGEGASPPAVRNVSLDNVPVFRSFRADGSIILGDGQTGQFTSATDPVSGDVLKVDVTLSLVK